MAILLRRGRQELIAGAVRSGGDTANRRRRGRLRLAALPDVVVAEPPALSTVMIGWLAVSFDLSASLLECIEVVECCQRLNRDGCHVVASEE